MRPGQQQQQNKQRMRGRSGRKGPNPLSRSLESNGPDVKIRGTAQHIADKYTTLARDAAAAGDRVMAENYLQHAEHYGRIVAAAQGQFQPSQPERDYNDFDEDGDDEGQGPEMAQPYAGGGQDRPQNGFNGERNAGGDRPQNDRPQNDRQNFRDGQNGRGDRRDNRENRGDRPFQNRDQNREAFARDNQNREGQNREGQGRDHQGRDDRRERDHRDNRQPGTGPQPFLQAPDFEGEAGAPRQDGARSEGGRRENRRDRARSNERSGERRFDERFGRPRPADDERAEAQADGAQPRAVVEASMPSASVETAPPVAPVAAFEPPVAAPAEPSNAEGRGRGRRRREAAAEEGVVPAPAPVPSEAAPSAEAAPVRRRTVKPVAETQAAPETVADDEAAPKRRAVRARRKKDDDEGDAGRTPSLITSDS